MNVVYRYILTNRGEIWDLREPEVRRYLGYIGNDADVTSRVVAGLGLVYLRRLGDRMRICMRPDFFPRPAFETLVYEFARRRSKRIAIEFVTPDTVEAPGVIAHLFHNLEDGIAYLDALRSQTPGEIERPSFFSTELDLKRLPSQNRQQLRALYLTWARARGQLSRERLDLMRTNPMNAPLLLTRRNTSGSFLVETWPKYLTLVPEDKVPGVIGNPIDQLSYSGDYAAEAAVGFREVIKRRAPILELVEAVVHFQSAPSRRVRYERLSLPWIGPGGDEFASTFSSFRSKRIVGS